MTASPNGSISLESRKEGSPDQFVRKEPGSPAASIGLNPGFTSSGNR